MLKPRKRLTKRQIKEDKLVTTYFKVLDFVEENSKLVTGVGAGVAVVIFLIIFFMWSKKKAELNASLEFTRARTELANSNMDTAIDIFKSMIKNYDGTRSAGRGTYYLANIYFDKGQYDEAIKYYKKYLEDYGEDPILSSASYSGIGASLEQKGEYLEAAKYYEKGAKKYSNNFEAPEQLMSAARCYKLANNKPEAEKIYQSIIDKYPNSRYKRNAELYLSELKG